MINPTAEGISKARNEEMEPRTLILIADDHAAVRRGLREMLAEEFQDATITEAANGGELLLVLATLQPSVLLLDLNMPGRSGLSLLRDVKRTYPRLPVLIVSVQPEELYAERCLGAGATGYINKDKAAEQLPDAIRLILNRDSSTLLRDSTNVGRTLQKLRGKAYKTLSVF